MAYTLLIFLPAVVCLFWIVIHLLMASRTSTFGLYLVLLVIALGAFFSYSCYDAPLSSWRMLDISSMLTLLFGPAMIPLIWMYLERMKPGDKYQNPLQLLWIMAPVALFTGALMIHMIAGGDNITTFMERLYTNGYYATKDMYYGTIEWWYHVWIAVVSRIVLAIEVVALLAMCITMSYRNDFKTKYLLVFLKGGKIKLRQIQMHTTMGFITLFTVKLAIPRAYLVTHPIIPAILGVLLAFFVFALSYFALFGDKVDISPKDVLYGWRFNYNRLNKADVVGEMIGELVEDAEDEALKRIRERLLSRGIDVDKWKSGMISKEKESSVSASVFAAVGDTWDENSLMSRFQHLMIDEQLFLQPSLTLQDVAERLHSNKTYISKLVNNTYNQGFPELINTLRVDYAEQYILNHRDAKQEAIATACGFLSASSFNSIFKKITGMTPKVWAASKDNK